MSVTIEEVVTFWTFTDHGLQVLGEMLRELTPYHERILEVDDFRDMVMTGHFLHAIDQNHAVGIVRLVVTHSPDFHGEIHDAIVDRTKRRQGIGTALLDEAVRRAKQLRLNYVDALVKPARTEFIKRCLSLGFELVSTADLKVAESTNRYRLTL